MVMYHASYWVPLPVITELYLKCPLGSKYTQLHCSYTPNTDGMTLSHRENRIVGTAECEGHWQFSQWSPAV